MISPNLRYTEMVLAESMRLFPPAWAMGRKAIKDFDLGPYRLPAKTTVLMSQYVTHREEKFFPTHCALIRKDSLQRLRRSVQNLHTSLSEQAGANVLESRSPGWNVFWCSPLWHKNGNCTWFRDIKCSPNH